MNPDLPHNSREELEAGLTALLLGELPPDQAAQLRRAIEQDAALAALHQRLKLTIDLVRETAVQPAGQTAVQPAPLKLSESRRQELLAHFKTVAPKEFARPRRQEWRSPGLVAAAAVLIALLAVALLLPALSSSKRKSLAMGPVKLRLADRDRTRSRALEDRSSVTQIFGSYGGYATFETNIIPYGSPHWAEAKAEEKAGADRMSAFLASLPSEAREQMSPAPQPQPAPVRTPQSENGRESPPPAPANRTAIILPGTTGANETAGQTEALNHRPGTPPSGGSSPSQTAGQTQAPSSVDAKHEVVRVFDLANADPQDTQQIVQDLMQRSGSIRANNNNNRNSMLGAGNPLIQRATQNPPDSFSADGAPPGSIVARWRQTQNLPEPSSPSSGPGNNLPRGRSGGGMLGGGVGGMDGKGGRLPAQAPSMASGRWKGGSMFGIPSDLTGILQTNQVSQSMAGGGGMGGGNASVAEASKLPQPALAPAAVASAAAPPAGPAAAIPFVSMPRDIVPGQVAANTAPPQDDGIPILGDKPVLGLGFDAEAAQAAAEEAELKKRELSRDLGSLTSAAKGLPAQTQAVAGVTTVSATLRGFYAEPPQQPGQDGLSDLSVAGQTNVPLAQQLDELQTADKLAKYPSNTILGDAYFSIDPESRRAVTIADEGNRRVISQATSNVDREKATNVEKPAAAAAFAGRYGYVVPLTAAAERDLASRTKLGPDIEKKWAIDNQRKLGELKESEKLTRGGIQAQHRARKVVESQLAQTQAKAAGNYFNGIGGMNNGEPLFAQAQGDVDRSDQPVKKQPAAPAPIPQPEVQTRENAFSTFSLNVSDVSFKLAGASLEKGTMPEPATVRSEEFINAFDYRDPEALAGVPVAFACERARYPFAHNRDLLRFSLKTAAQGRQAGRPLNVVLLLDNSGSMERADRVRIIHEALRVLAGQLQPQDKLSVVTFARTARLWVDGMPGSQAGQVAEEVSGLTPQGGTNLEEAMNLAYQTALRHYLANGINRVVLLTDGAANLGNVQPEALKQKVEAHRKQGVALDCFGIGWEGYNDDLLEVLSRNGDGRYGFLNTPEEAASEFAGQLAGALRVAASDVKVQVEFNPARVRAYRQIGYARHQLAKEQFRDNTVNAAQIGAAESGNALYVIETDPRGDGPLGVVRVHYRVPGTSDYHEQEWTAPYTGSAAPLEQSSAALRLAAVAGAFSEWLVSSPFAAEVTTDRLLGYLRGVPEVYGPDARPGKLEWMIRQAQSLGGK